MIPTYLNQLPRPLTKQVSLTTVVEEICEKSDPPPLFCELPDDLKFHTDYHATGTAQTYTYTSGATITSSGIGTTTSTTTTL